MDMTGNTILITGGGSGIGRALAEALHARGNKVILSGRRAGALEAVAAANPGMVTATLDVSDPADIARFAAEIVAAHPDLNVVIHNAGIMQAETLAAPGSDLAIAEATIATNLLGPLRLNAALLPHLLARPSATVITVSSGLAFVPLTLTPTYGATKAAIHSWSQSLRYQLRDTNVEVIEIVPPAVATDLMPGHAEDPNSMPLADYIAETMAQLEAGAPENLTERVKFLRFAEARGDYEKVFAVLNGGAH
ncbi:SDR family NAD(P)-dependent oxidoreductase [Sphingomonas sp. HITSZ_GF]|uniref:SDR family oxidoreductase n=1 Tax=Sphingomonas sp. HITSZ_GF TaxID=3037247 RepID=UPI00240E03D4|nr:SDR family NAD(P)-dependent oxidoreductase [Sphingomonas sp. HITSZ_GF]MDG2532911.1 SDR family NAD(P)-dependent oxidoreductase [Sphingomonas sp. HITSZ_GF]